MTLLVRHIRKHTGPVKIHRFSNLQKLSWIAFGEAKDERLKDKAAMK